jgi:hypothetical protein
VSGLTKAQQAVLGHVETFFDGHEVRARRWRSDPMDRRLPQFRVIHVSPGPRSTLWTYITAACWDAVHTDEHGLEFIVTGGESHDPRHVERLAISAYYHCNPDDETYRLDIGHTVPLGEPYAPGATVDHFLVSLPYPFGPDLEVCDFKGGHARLLWLLPITEAEKRFRHEHDLEALEQRFDDAEIQYWDLARPSVV